MKSLFNMLDNIENKNEGEDSPAYFFKLWFTCVSYMNDPMEEVLFKQCLYLALKEYQDRNHLLDRSHLLQIAYMGLEVKRGEGYTISLSENSDSLSMWRAYGSNGQGVALAFDLDELSKALCQQEKCKLLKMNYKSDYEFVRSFEEEELEMAYNAIEERENGGSVGITIYEQLYDKYQNVKNIFYSDEREWRLVINHDLSRKTDFRERNGLIIPYYEIELPLNVVSHFVIGPCAEKELSKRSLESMVFHRARGFRDGEEKIYLSDIPYVLR